MARSKQPLRRSSASATQRRRLFSAVPGLAVMEALFEGLADVLFCVKDAQRRYIAANAAFVRAAGLRTPSALIGRTAGELFPALLAAGYGQQDDEVFQRGVEIRDRLEMITRRDGSLGWFVTQKIPVRDASGAIAALAAVSRDLATPAAAGRELDTLNDALQSLHLDFAEPLRISQLARQARLSLSQFQRRVSSLTGLTPRQLLTKSRVEAAAQALRETTRPIGDIALECGFYDQATLCRQFRALTGLSPREYRQLLTDTSF